MAAAPGAGRTGSPLRIAVLAHNRFPIRSPFMGGMEAHCAALCEGLCARGHSVTLFAAPGSQSPAAVRAICEAPYEDVLPWSRWRATPELAAYQDAAFSAAWADVRQGGFDVVHNNSLYHHLLAWADRDRVPMLTSQHVPPFGNMFDAVMAAAGKPGLQISVTSQDQVPLWFTDPPANLAVVHNGIDTDAWQPGLRGGAFLWAGRITPNKGTAEALEAARIADVPLDLAGLIEDEAYYEARVAPLLDARRRHLGHIGGPALRATVANARALVMAPMWAEPFGLVAAEALACDVPVIAFDRGAMREVVGDCGTLVPAGDVDALAGALADPPDLLPGQARQRALDLFSIPAMIAGYEALYAKAMAA